MPIKYHGNAKTNIHIRNEIKNSTETIDALALKFNLNKNTVLKWKKRADIEDRSCRPHKLRNILSPDEERKICNCRKKNQASIDQICEILKPDIPHINRYLVYRCLIRNNAMSN